MYNTIYDDEGHGLEVWRERQARRRASQICKRVGLRISDEYLEHLDIKQVRRIISAGLGLIEVLEGRGQAHRSAVVRTAGREPNA